MNFAGHMFPGSSLCPPLTLAHEHSPSYSKNYPLKKNVIINLVEAYFAAKKVAIFRKLVVSLIDFIEAYFCYKTRMH